jgi:hypothetical protein
MQPPPPNAPPPSEIISLDVPRRVRAFTRAYLLLALALLPLGVGALMLPLAPYFASNVRRNLSKTSVQLTPTALVVKYFGTLYYPRENPTEEVIAFSYGPPPPPSWRSNVEDVVVLQRSGDCFGGVGGVAVKLKEGLKDDCGSVIPFNIYNLDVRRLKPI